MDEYYCVASSGGGRFTDKSNVAVIAVVVLGPKSNAQWIILASYSKSS